MQTLGESLYYFVILHPPYPPAPRRQPQICECRAEYAANTAIWGHCYNGHILFGI